MFKSPARCELKMNSKSQDQEATSTLPSRPSPQSLSSMSSFDSQGGGGGEDEVPIRSTVRNVLDHATRSNSGHVDNTYSNAFNLHSLGLSQDSLLKFIEFISISEFDLISELRLVPDSFPIESSFQRARVLLKRYSGCGGENNRIVLSLGEEFVITWSTSTRIDAGVPSLAHYARFVHPALQIPNQTNENNGGGGGGNDLSSLEDLGDEDYEQKNNNGVGLLMHGGFLFFDMDGNIIGVSEMAKHGKDVLSFEECVSMSMIDAKSLDARWRTSSLFTQQFLSTSQESSISTASPSILLKMASSSKGKLWTTWIYPAEMIDSKRPTRFGGLGILFHPDIKWKPKNELNGQGERLKLWHLDEMLELEKRTIALEKPTVFIFPLSSSHFI